MNPLRSLAPALCAALLICGTGCRGSGKTKVAFVSNNAESFWSIARVGAEKAAAESDVQLLFQMPDDTDQAKQKEKVDQVLRQGIKGIAISVIDPEKQDNYLKSISKRVTLLTQDNDAPNCGRTCYIGTDNYQAGRAAGALVKQAMPEGGMVAIFVGDLAALNARQRRQGVADELAGKKDAPTTDGSKLGKYTLFKTYLDAPRGKEQAKINAVQALNDDRLKKETNLCMVGLWAYNPPQIYSAVKDAGKLGKVKIVGFDEDTLTLKGIKEGHIHGTIVQQPYEFGYRSVKLLAQLAKGDKSGVPADGIMYVPHLAVTAEGKEVKTADGTKTEGRPVEAFQKELNKLLGK